MFVHLSRSRRSRVCTLVFLCEADISVEKEDVWNSLECGITWWLVGCVLTYAQLNLRGSKRNRIVAAQLHPHRQQRNISSDHLLDSANYINFSCQQIGSTSCAASCCSKRDPFQVPTINNPIKRSNDLARSHLHRFDDRFVYSKAADARWWRLSILVDRIGSS